MIKSRKLNKYKDLKHAFFDRLGGKSSGIFKSLNCGPGSSDKKKNILSNLQIVCKKISPNSKKITALCVHNQKNQKKTIGILHIHNILQSNIQ